MTKVLIYRDQERIVGFELEGHSGYAAHGADIVCAAISAISQTCLLGIEEVLHIRPMLKIDEKTGLMRLKLKEADIESAQQLLLTMVLGLRSIHIQYPDHIRITFRERRS